MIIANILRWLHASAPFEFAYSKMNEDENEKKKTRVVDVYAGDGVDNDLRRYR